MLVIIALVFLGVFAAIALPLMGSGDWNDGMNQVGTEGRGESVWLGWFFLTVLRSAAVLAEKRDPQRDPQRRDHGEEGKPSPRREELPQGEVEVPGHGFRRRRPASSSRR